MAINWKNVDLESEYEKDQNILDPYSFNTLLLEIGCNIEKINKATVRKQFEKELSQKIETAREIFDSNIDNITRKARAERKQD